MASVYDIELDQGSDAVIPFEMYDANDTPLDLSGYTARMQTEWLQLNSTSACTTPSWAPITTTETTCPALRQRSHLRSMRFPKAITENSNGDYASRRESLGKGDQRAL